MCVWPSGGHYNTVQLCFLEIYEIIGISGVRSYISGRKLLCKTSYCKFSRMWSLLKMKVRVIQRHQASVTSLRYVIMSDLPSQKQKDGDDGGLTVAASFQVKSANSGLSQSGTRQTSICKHKKKSRYRSTENRKNFSGGFLGIKSLRIKDAGLV